MEEGTVLIASSDEPLAEYLYHQLNGFGWNVIRLTGVGEMIHQVKEREDRILILDSNIEGIPAFDLLPLIKKTSPGIPVISLGEDSSLESSKRVRLQGIFFLAMKPIDPEEIRAAAGDAIRMLKKREQRRTQDMAKVIPFNTLDKVQEILQAHEGNPGHLLIVLQKIQGIYGYVPPFTLDLVSQVLGVTKSDIFGVLTFYNRFHLTPRGKHTVRACRGTACHFKDASSIIESIRGYLKLAPGKETTKDFRFSLEEVACLGACGISPVMTIDEETYGKLTPVMAVEAIAQFEKAAKAPAEVPEVAEEEKKAA